MIENIRHYWNLATDADLHGNTWYSDANVIANRISGGDVVKGAGVIAALSPITPWNRNLALASRTFENGHLDGGTLGTSLRNANRIMDGEHPLDVLKGEKVRNFFMCIADPSNRDAVCIDRHAFSVAMGRYVDDKGRTPLARKGMYEKIADAYRAVAAEFDVPAHEVQSVTWVVFRRVERNIID